MTDFEKECLKVFGDERPLKSYPLTFTYRSGKTHTLTIIAYDRRSAKKKAQDYVRMGLAHEDGDELVSARLEEEEGK